ncbi:PREDICTED: threonylcarbamoyladenosine tRNA methylthiotransferase-like [Tinamus guttatus]|uniref:threonylcarbamoyladenosine tRNA methylthiotransferase-like n=1 Tax=Tinamus guttatus TaxID=94827 RepID=UPI00052E832D|nr:PREDICTED: threonylcarbamoyladenosine tRNA methylthiotransferase-like [Tinamus guttatus]
MAPWLSPCPRCHHWRAAPWPGIQLCSSSSLRMALRPDLSREEHFQEEQPFFLKFASVRCNLEDSQPIKNSAEADLWLLNSCTVKNPAEDHFRNSIKKAQEGNKKVVLAGCVPQAQPRQDYLKGLSIIGVQQIDRVVEVVEETIKGHSVRLLGQKKDNGKRLGGARLDLPKIRKNPLIEIISVNTGCLNACTYCKTKHARGDLASYPIEELVDRAKQSFQEGVCEIWLTSEDTGAYGRDIGTDLPTLLWKLVEAIPEGAMLRLGMTNPPYILEHLEVRKLKRESFICWARPSVIESAWNPAYSTFHLKQELKK